MIREKREREQERKRQWERGGRQKTLSIWPSGEHARTHTHTLTHRCKQCYFLVLFYSHSTVINNTSRTNILTTSAHTWICIQSHIHTHTHLHIVYTKHMQKCETDILANRQTDSPTRQTVSPLKRTTGLQLRTLTPLQKHHNVDGFKDWITHTHMHEYTQTHTHSWSYYNFNTIFITAQGSKLLFLATKSLFLSSNKDDLLSALVCQMDTDAAKDQFISMHTLLN